jgi:hypothetical protein
MLSVRIKVCVVEWDGKTASISTLCTRLCPRFFLLQLDRAETFQEALNLQLSPAVDSKVPIELKSRAIRIWKAFLVMVRFDKVNHFHGSRLPWVSSRGSRILVSLRWPLAFRYSS